MCTAAVVPLIAVWRWAGIEDVESAPRTFAIYTHPFVVLDNMRAGCLQLIEQMLPGRILGRRIVAAAGSLLLAAPAVVTLSLERDLRSECGSTTETGQTQTTSSHLVRANMVLVTSCVVYLVSVAGVQLFLDPTTPFDLRILSPFYIMWVMALAVTATLLSSAEQSLRGRNAGAARACAGVLVLVLAVTAFRATRFALSRLRSPAVHEVSMHEDQLTGEIRIVVERYGDGRRLVSNAQGRVWYDLRQNVERLDERMVRKVAQVQKAPALLLLFRNPAIVEDDKPSVEQSVEATHSKIVYESQALIVATVN